MAPTPFVALLGCGYTLERVAKKLGSGAALCIKRNADALQLKGFLAASCDAANVAQLLGVTALYKSITTIVDSIPPPSDDPTRYANAVKELALSNPSITRIIYLSTTGVFGGEHGETVNEDSQPNPKTPSAKARYDIECFYQGVKNERARRNQPIEVCAVRIPAIYGPGRGIGISLKNQSYKMIGNGEQWSNRIHVDDLVQGITQLITCTATLPSCCVMTDGNPAKINEVVQFYCEKFNLPLPVRISKEEAAAAGQWTQLSNQKVFSTFCAGIQLQYPSYQEGAGTEFVQE